MFLFGNSRIKKINSVNFARALSDDRDNLIATALTSLQKG